MRERGPWLSAVPSATRTSWLSSSARSARLRQDVTVSLEDTANLRRLLEENPIAAWSGGRGTDHVSYFAYDNGRLRFVKDVQPDRREAFQELVREIVEWRLAAYLQRDEGAAEDRFVCKVSHANQRPLLFLPDRAHYPELPSGWTDVSIDGEVYEANFVKVALNVVRRKGSDANELPGILRRWFGPNAGLPGTDFRVVLEQDERGYTLAPLGRTS